MRVYPDLRTLTVIVFLLTFGVFAMSSGSISAEETSSVNTDSLISGDAIILTLRLQEGIWLDTTLALEIDIVLEIARSQYDTLRSIHTYREYIPTNLLLKSNASWTQGWREGNLMTGNSTIDSLTEIYGMISVSESPYWFVLEFAQPLKIPLLSQLYKVVAGVIDAWPKYVCCVIDNIEAFMKDQIWHLAFTHGWGDCPAGCIHRYYWYVTIDKNLNTLLVEERYRDFGTPWIYLWNIPPRYAATVFNNLGELFSAAQFAPEWWVRRHAVEVIGLLFVKDYPWVGEDFSNQTIFDALKDGVLSRRKEVIRILQRRMGDPDPDVRTSAQRALNRALGLSEESLAFYFPLHVGNSWTFLDASAFSPSTFTETTVDTQHIGGNHYFQFDRFRHFPNVLLRMSEDDKLLMRWDGEKQVWLDFSADVGDTWTVSAPGGGSQWLVHLESKTDTIIVPAGTFTNCYRFWFDFGCCDNDWVEWYAPGIGPVKRVLYGIWIIEYPLMRAIIDGMVIPGLKGDVDGNGQIDVTDVLLLVNFIIGFQEPTLDQFWAADYNNDNALNVLDVVLTVRAILG